MGASGRPLVYMNTVYTVFLILCVAVASVEGGGYGQSCGKMSDCDQRDSPICSIYWKDRSWALNTQTSDPTSAKEPSAGTYNGFCVQCQSDCDCGVNQYCGIDRDTPLVIPAGIRSTNDATRNGITPENKLLVDLYGKAFAGMPMRSKCYDYEEKKDTCNANTIVNNEMYATPVEQVRLSDGFTEKILRTPNFWPQSETSRFCGRIAQFGPAFQAIDASGGLVSSIPWSATRTSEVVSTGQFYASPAQCPKTVAFKDSTYTCNSCGSGPLACNADGTRPQTQINPLCTPASGPPLTTLNVPTAFQLLEQCALTYDSTLSPGASSAGYMFRSPSVEWQGFCNRGSCQICKESGEPADDRCQAGGIRRRCLNGRWVSVQDLNPTSTQYDINRQTNLATSIGQWMVPLLLTILAILLCCLFCKRDKSDKSDDERDFEAQQPLQQRELEPAPMRVEKHEPLPPHQKVYVNPVPVMQSQPQMVNVPGYEPVPMSVYGSQQRVPQGTTMASF